MLELDASGEAVAATARMAPACNTNCKAAVSKQSLQTPNGKVCVQSVLRRCSEAAQAELNQ